ncbi:hypothetical protein BB560_001603 [Smittium megazygosporum]|uniref:Mitochondrial carrier n=1 Tax=Smittium megazygosporum TaxID=133381 RepID=A0A2T9ZH10_9FUNG|nr:hypothetical protein BB560_001603 [Smittium megazygosporum]
MSQNQTQTSQAVLAPYSQPKPKVPFFVREFVSGTVGGWALVVVGHPFDTIKVRIQTQPSPPIYKNAIDCLQKTVSKEGFSGLYKGAASPLLGIGFCNAIVFTSNGFFKKLLADQNNTTPDQLSLANKALAGSLAGFAMALLNCPVELLKVKLQVQTDKKLYSGVIDCGVKSVREHGFRALFRGLPITIMRDMPALGCYFGTYEFCKLYSTRFSSLSTPQGSPSQFAMFMSGGIAGVVSWLLSYPLDMLKSRMQMNYTYKSLGHTFSAMRTEAQSRGYSIFYKGLAPTLARAFPANAATFLAYELVSDLLK